MSGLYAGHFALAAGPLNDAEKAFRIIERARGRALADLLRVVPSDDPRPADDERLSAVAGLQLRLMRARTAAERQGLLDDLFEVEQRITMRRTITRAHGRPPLRGGILRGFPTCSGPWRRRRCSSSSCCLSRVPTAWPSARTGSSWCRFLAGSVLSFCRNGCARICRAAARPWAGRAASSMTPLLAPVASNWRDARRLFVVPDGELNLLPFDAVIAANDPTAAGLSVAVAPSARVLALLRTKGEQVSAKRDRPLLAIGGVPYDRMNGRSSGDTARVGSAITGFFDAAMPAKLPTLPRAEAEGADGGEHPWARQRRVCGRCRD